MDYFNAKLRLGGSLHNEIQKLDISAAEVVLLRAIHGSDAVVDLKKIGERKVSSAAERAKLEGLYGVARNKVDQRILDVVFPSMAPLPHELEDAEPEEIDETDVSEIPLEPAKKKLKSADLGL